MLLLYLILVNKFCFREHVYVSKVLSELMVWQEAAIPGGLLGWILNATFKKNLKIALLGG